MYTYRNYNAESVGLFKDWIVMNDWKRVLDEPDVNKKTELYQSIITSAIEKFFPLKKRRKKDRDPPWMSKKILKEIKDRKRLFQEEGGVRTQLWKDKFDDETLDLYLDVKFGKDEDWQRIDAAQALEANKGRQGRTKGIDAGRLRELLNDQADK